MTIIELRNSALGNQLTGLPHNKEGFSGGEICPIYSDKSGNDIKCSIPRNMCWNSISNFAEVWCCSEHYLWLFDGGL